MPRAGLRKLRLASQLSTLRRTFYRTYPTLYLPALSPLWHYSAHARSMFGLQSPDLKTLGMGTAKVEAHLTELFPEHDVIRVDRDSTSRVGSWQKFMTESSKTSR